MKQHLREHTGEREHQQIEVGRASEGRLQAANPSPSINVAVDVPTTPLQHLYEDDEQELQISTFFQQAFAQDLVLNRAGGSQITLHIGARPVPPVGKDRLSSEYRLAVHALPQLQSQGDGIRAFTGILLHVLVIDRDIILIDEPEAFLHAPQATSLGRMLARETPNPRQLIVATHSTDFLRGVLDIPGSPVRVVRIQRQGQSNRIKELSPAAVREVARPTTEVLQDS